MSASEGLGATVVDAPPFPFTGSEMDLASGPREEFSLFELYDAKHEVRPEVYQLWQVIRAVRENGTGRNGTPRPPEHSLTEIVGHALALGLDHLTIHSIYGLATGTAAIRDRHDLARVSVPLDMWTAMLSILGQVTLNGRPALEMLAELREIAREAERGDRA